MSNSTETLRENIQKRMELLGLSQKELAERMGKAPAAISVWMAGKKQPSLPVVDEFALALETTTADLLKPAEKPERKVKVALDELLITLEDLTLQSRRRTAEILNSKTLTKDQKELELEAEEEIRGRGGLFKALVEDLSKHLFLIKNEKARPSGMFQDVLQKWKEEPIHTTALPDTPEHILNGMEVFPFFPANIVQMLMLCRSHLLVAKLNEFLKQVITENEPEIDLEKYQKAPEAHTFSDILEALKTAHPETVRFIREYLGRDQDRPAVLRAAEPTEEPSRVKRKPRE